MTAANTISLVHITTIPASLNFFRGQVGHLKADGFHVEAISSPGDLLGAFAAQEGITCHAVQMAREIDPRRDVVSLWRLWRRLRSLRPDIVHSHTPKAGLLGTVAARLARRPVVFLSIFGLVQMTATGPKRRVLDAMTWVACRLAHRVWCDSASNRDLLVSRRLCDPAKIFVLGSGSVNGVHAADRFAPDTYSPEVREEVRSRYGVPSDAPVVGFVGRLVGDKGMHELADAWRLLRDRWPDLHLLLVGPFEDKDPLAPDDRTLFETDERIHLAGRRADVPEHFLALDVFVLPSYREGFSITNIEAAAMGLPVVSTRIPGCVDSVQDGMTGTLVPSHDAPALAAALESYLLDPDLRRRHGAAGRERALRDFRPEAIWSGLEAEYRQQLEQRGRGRSVRASVLMRGDRR